MPRRASRHASTESDVDVTTKRRTASTGIRPHGPRQTHLLARDVIAQYFGCISPFCPLQLQDCRSRFPFRGRRCTLPVVAQRRSACCSSSRPCWLFRCRPRPKFKVAASGPARCFRLLRPSPSTISENEVSGVEIAIMPTATDADQDDRKIGLLLVGSRRPDCEWG